MCIQTLDSKVQMGYVSAIRWAINMNSFQSLTLKLSLRNFLTDSLIRLLALFWIKVLDYLKVLYIRVDHWITEIHVNLRRAYFEGKDCIYSILQQTLFQSGLPYFTISYLHIWYPHSWSKYKNRYYLAVVVVRKLCSKWC